MMKTLKVGEQAQFEYALMDEIVKLQEALEMNQVHALTPHPQPTPHPHPHPYSTPHPHPYPHPYPHAPPHPKP